MTQHEAYGTVGAFDFGLLSPVSAGRDELVSDAAVLHGLVGAEVALIAAYEAIDAAPAGIGDAAEALYDIALDGPELARDAVAGGNPVIALVKLLRAGAPDDVRPWVHRGATSQDIVDTALMLVSHEAAGQVLADLARAERALTAFAAAHRDTVAAGRTLTQHAVPTTIGLRAANWLRGIRRASARLRDARSALPAQLGGAAGTMAAAVDVLAGAGRSGSEPADSGPAADSAGTAFAVHRALELRDAYAAELGLAPSEAPWHTTRWPVTELGDALAQAVAALGTLATDVATASRTEIGELAEPSGGGSSAMPQKQNPARSVLIRSAAMRAPQLAATLHLAAGLAVDERPDGAWHAEWPALRELLRTALGAASHAADLVEGLRVDPDAVAKNLGATGGLIVSERISAVLGKGTAAEIVAAAAAGGDLRALVAEAGADPDALLDPADYTGLAGEFVDRATTPS